MDTKPVVVSCELHWPFLNKQNEMSGKYQVDIGKLSSKAVDALSGMGIAVRNTCQHNSTQLNTCQHFLTNQRGTKNATQYCNAIR